MRWFTIIGFSEMINTNDFDHLEAFKRWAKRYVLKLQNIGLALLNLGQVYD